MSETVWVLGDQCNRRFGALRDADPATTTVLMVESATKLASKRWHRQRAHVVLSTMRHFAAELRDEGFTVDYRHADSLPTGLAEHRAEYAPDTVRAMEPASYDGWEMLERLGCELVRTDQFLCHPDQFRAWAGAKRTLRMEDFYRWQRTRTGWLMDGDVPATGRWNFDDRNREPPPKRAPVEWPRITPVGLDEIDEAVIADLPDDLAGAPPVGLWPTTRAVALARLDEFVEEVLPTFGPYQDAMLTSEWRMRHALLSSSMNLSLLHPSEVCERVDEAYRSGAAPIESAEGFLRQVLGWREYVWGVYWLWMPEYRTENRLEAHDPLPPAFDGAPTDMRCVATTIKGVHEHGYAHHIQRLMVLGNLSLLAGVEPQELVDWMWSSFVDGAEWVMLPNVVGMALHADGGKMATKPYAGSGAYIDRMSDYCRGCRFDRKARTGEDACPFTTLYWDFLDRHRDRFVLNHRMTRQVGALDRLGDLDEVRVRAREVRARLADGRL